MIYDIGEVFVDKKFIYFYCFSGLMEGLDYISSVFSGSVYIESKIINIRNNNKFKPSVFSKISENIDRISLYLFLVDNTESNLNTLEELSSMYSFSPATLNKESMAEFVVGELKVDIINRILDSDYEFTLKSKEIEILYICHFLENSLYGMNEIAPFWEIGPKVSLGEILTKFENLTEGTMTIKCQKRNIDFLYGKTGGNVLGLVPTRLMFPPEFLKDKEVATIPDSNIREVKVDDIEEDGGVGIVYRSVPTSFVPRLLEMFDTSKEDFLILSGRMKGSLEEFNKFLSKQKELGVNIESLYLTDSGYILKLYFKGLRINGYKFYLSDLGEFDSLSDPLVKLDKLELFFDALQMKIFDKNLSTGARGLIFNYSIVMSALFEFKEQVELIKLIESVSKKENRPIINNRINLLIDQRKWMEELGGPDLGKYLEKFWEEDMALIRFLILFVRLFNEN